MTNDKFIKIIMSKNALMVDSASFSLMNMNFTDVGVKIDTGCSLTTIPLQKLNIGQNIAREYKRKRIECLVETIQSHMSNGKSLDEAIRMEYGKSFKLSYGVESGGKVHKPIDFLNMESIMDAEEISFKCMMHNIDFNGLQLPDRKVYVNYDRLGNVLIGMDILKEWDVHMGTIDTGETIFLGCPKDWINDEYLQELENTFHIVSYINTSGNSQTE